MDKDFGPQKSARSQPSVPSPFPLLQFRVSLTELLFPLFLSLSATQPANVGLSCLSYGPGHNVNISSNQFELLSLLLLLLLVLLLLLCLLLLFANVIVIMFEWSRRAQTALKTHSHTHTQIHSRTTRQKLLGVVNTLGQETLQRAIAFCV